MSRPKQVLIAEDEPLAAEYLSKLIRSNHPDLHIAGITDSISTTLAWLEQHQPDLLFLDIHLADGNSISLFEKKAIQVPVIFTTAFDQYAVKAFRLNSIDYLLKPIDPDELNAAIEKFQKRIQSSIPVEAILAAIQPPEMLYKERFLVQQGTSYVSVHQKEIAYFFAEDKWVFLVTTDGRKLLSDMTLNKLEGLLPPKTFFRINRKILLAASAIKRMQSYSRGRFKIELTPDKGIEAVVSIERSASFIEWLDS